MSNYIPEEREILVKTNVIFREKKDYGLLFIFQIRKSKNRGGKHSLLVKNIN